MAQPIISAENIGKRYRLQHQAKQPYSTLRDALTAQAKRLFGGSSVTDDSHADSHDEFWALKEVNFEIQRGDVVGIIGRNGAGKSTLLKVLSRIIEPTTGRITLRGRVASLLEVGTGFHPELTGRENIFLNGAILGMSKWEIRSKFDEIVAFAEIEKFLDTPVKRYSSGMYVRLAFAVAAHLEPEILIVDEVLAVGDAEFQKKCLGKMRDVSGRGRTVLFVSHNIGAVSSLCSTAFLLRGGRIVESGPVTGVIAAYAAQSRPTSEGFHADGRRGQPTDCRIVDAWLVINGQRAGRVDWDSPFEIVVDVVAERDIAISTEYLIRDNNGLPILFSPTGLQQNVTLRLGSGRHRVTAACPALGLATGSYTIDLMLVESSVRCFDYCESALRFEVTELHSRPNRWGFSQTQGQGFAPFTVRVSVETVSAEGGPCEAS